MFKALLIGAICAVGTVAWEDGVDCTSDGVATAGTPGLLYVVDSNGFDVPCEDVDSASAEVGCACYRTTDDSSSLGDRVECPSDPAPEKNPDGSVISPVADGLIKTYCAAAAGAPPLIDFADIIGCLSFGYYAANGDPIAEAETGAKGICNTILAGACTWFADVAPIIAGSMDVPCTDDPGSNACAFANPGKKLRRMWIA